MSGHAHDTLERHGITTDRAFFLQKPFFPSTLVKKIRETLHGG